MGTNFNDFNISDEILKSIEGLGYVEPSEVQAKVIPMALEDKDIIVRSQTGSGKTAAFAIPICNKIKWEENLPQALILVPTRELAVQVKEDFINIGRFKRIKPVAVFGKQPFSEQSRNLKQKAHCVVGTPGRVLDHLERETLKIENIRYFVIDEADEMLNMGFISQVEEIINKLPKNRVTMLFSATISKEIQELCSKYMIEPISIDISTQKLVTDKIEHTIYRVDERNKLDELNSILINEVPETGVIFCRTKENVDMIYNFLNQNKYSIGKIHGGMLQQDRLYAMKDFKNGEFRLLVATDVAARGIDVEGITHVINFDIPVEKESYVHRIGRTARAGSEGKAITFATNYENKFIRDIESLIGFSIEQKSLPLRNEVCQKKESSLKILKSKPIKKKDKSGSLNSNITKIYLNGGKGKKIRPIDIVGTINNIDGVNSEDIGIIDVQDAVSYVDILNGKGNIVIEALGNMTIKGKKLKVEKAKIK